MFEETTYLLPVAPYKVKALKHVDINNKRIRKENNKWVTMPPDDGYDDAFFMFLHNPYEDFEWIVYTCNVYALPFYNILLNCGYLPFVKLLSLLKHDEVRREEYMKKIVAYYKANGRIK